MTDSERLEQATADIDKGLELFAPAPPPQGVSPADALKQLRHVPSREPEPESE